MNPLGLKVGNATADTIYWMQVQHHKPLSNNKKKHDLKTCQQQQQTRFVHPKMNQNKNQTRTRIGINRQRT